jgi:ankyrin repeat protein
MQITRYTGQPIETLEAIWQYTAGSVSSETVNSALYGATDREKADTVNFFLERFGASPDATGDEYGNALIASAYDGTLDILRMLLDGGAKSNSPNGWALQTAAAQGHLDVVKELLIRGANVDACSTK